MQYRPPNAKQDSCYQTLYIVTRGSRTWPSSLAKQLVLWRVSLLNVDCDSLGRLVVASEFKASICGEPVREIHRGNGPSEMIRP